MYFVRTFVKHSLYNIFNKLFGYFYYVGKLCKSHLWFNLPKLCCVTSCVTVLCSESRSKRINLSHCHCCNFAFELAGNSKSRLLTEKVLLIILGCGLGGIVPIVCCHTKYLACAFTIAACYNGRMNVYVIVFLKISVYSRTEFTSHPKHSVKCVCAHSQMRNRSQILHSMTLLLKRIIGRAIPEQHNIGGVNFHPLSVYGFYESTLNFYGTPQRRATFVAFSSILVDYHLQMLKCSTVIYFHKCHILRFSIRTYPTANGNGTSYCTVFNLAYIDMFHKKSFVLFYT